MATDPLQGGPTPSPNPGADPVNALAPKPPGQPSHDDHDTSGPPAPETIARGYEEDVYDTKTVLSVPVLVVLFFVVAFGATTVLFTIFSPKVAQPNAHPQAKARNEADLNTRIARIGRGKEVDQPRLDQLDIRTGDARAITRPKAKDGNSPQLHPEDLIPSVGQYPELYTSDKTRVGLDKTLALGDDALKVLFKAAPGAAALPEDASLHASTGSNAGRGFGPSQAVSPKLPEAKVEPKKVEPVAPPKAAPKGTEPKKTEPPKDTKGGKP